MNAVELLGGLLKNRAGSSGGGGGLLKDLIGGALKSGRSGQAPQAGGGSSRGGGGDLGDFVRDALSKHTRKHGGGTPGSQSADCNDPRHQGHGQSRGQGRAGQSELNNDQAVVLIRAMINAAKSDGQLDPREQETIVKQLGQLSQDEVQFLKREFAAPLDVKEFTWSVPRGLERQVYSLSLMAISLDQNKEATYLKNLAHGLRLDPEVCNRIHQQYKAPQIFS